MGWDIPVWDANGWSCPSSRCTDGLQSGVLLTQNLGITSVNGYTLTLTSGMENRVEGSRGIAP